VKEDNMQPENLPLLSPYFVGRRWDLANQAELRRELEKAITEDPEIDSKTTISVVPEEKGSKITAIHLNGTVGSDREKERAQQIVSVNTREEVEVVNELVVK
jgi:hypothetical protein